MTEEVDLDAFVGEGVVELREPEPRTVTRDIIEQERERHRQMTLEGAEEPVKNVTPVRSYLVGLVYASRSGGGPHIVTLHHDSKGGARVLCICEATLNLDRRPAGCWAMVDAREILGLDPIGGV